MPESPVLSEDDMRFYLAPSTLPGAGMGIFARVHLEEGDCLRVEGVLIAPGSAADACTAYADSYKLRVGDSLLIAIGYGGMANHSAQRPNMVKSVIGKACYLKALRAIEPGEELLYAYSSYAVERYCLDG